jgi:hypothetical protein
MRRAAVELAKILAGDRHVSAAEADCIALALNQHSTTAPRPSRALLPLARASVSRVIAGHGEGTIYSGQLEHAHDGGRGRP